jgi:hypothetical protein
MTAKRYSRASDSAARLKRIGLLVAAFFYPIASASAAESAAADDGWIDLFNGKDLNGWTAKITGYPAGENFANTFRVEEGLLKVRYDGYERFDGRFGHLFWQEPLDHYHLVVEYRFIGEQAEGGAGWARRNSGVMLHAQAADTMTLQQEFPDSIEAQFLGGLGGSRSRPTNNLCTPGTDVVFEGSLYTPHCLFSNSETFDGDQWVRAEVIVRGSGRISHLVNSEVVLEYSEPRLSDQSSHQKGATPLLESGFIALQSESQPIDFRVVRYRRLEP